MTERFANTATLRQLLELDDEMLLRVAAGMKRGIWFGTAVFDGAKEAEIKALLAAAELPSSGKTTSVRRHDRRRVRTAGHGGLHLHAEAFAPGRRQDSRSFDRTVLPHHPAAAGRQGAIRRTAFRRDGSVGPRSIRRRLHPAGAADRQVRRRLRPHQDLRGHRQGRSSHRAGCSGIVQRADP